MASRINVFNFCRNNIILIFFILFMHYFCVSGAKNENGILAKSGSSTNKIAENGQRNGNKKARKLLGTLLRKYQKEGKLKENVQKENRAKKLKIVESEQREKEVQKMKNNPKPLTAKELCIKLHEESILLGKKKELVEGQEKETHDVLKSALFKRTFTEAEFVKMGKKEGEQIEQTPLQQFNIAEIGALKAGLEQAKLDGEESLKKELEQLEHENGEQTAGPIRDYQQRREAVLAEFSAKKADFKNALYQKKGEIEKQFAKKKAQLNEIYKKWMAEQKPTKTMVMEKIDQEYAELHATAMALMAEMSAEYKALTNQESKSGFARLFSMRKTKPKKKVSKRRQKAMHTAFNMYGHRRRYGNGGGGGGSGHYGGHDEPNGPNDDAQLDELMRTLGQEESALRKSSSFGSGFQPIKAYNALRAGYAIYTEAKANKKKDGKREEDGKEEKDGSVAGKLAQLWMKGVAAATGKRKNHQDTKKRGNGEADSDSDSSSSIFTSSDGDGSSRSSFSSSSSSSSTFPSPSSSPGSSRPSFSSSSFSGTSSGSPFTDQNLSNRDNDDDDEEEEDEQEDHELPSFHLPEDPAIVTAEVATSGKAENNKKVDVKFPPQLLAKFAAFQEAERKMCKKREEANGVEKEFDRLARVKGGEVAQKWRAVENEERRAFYEAGLEIANRADAELRATRERLQNLYSKDELYANPENPAVKLPLDQLLDKCGTRLANASEKAQTKQEWDSRDLAVKIGQLAKLEPKISALQKLREEMEQIEAEIGQIRQKLGGLNDKEIEQKCEEEMEEFEDAQSDWKVEEEEKTKKE